MVVLFKHRIQQQQIKSNQIKQTLIYSLSASREQEVGGQGCSDPNQTQPAL